MSHSAKNATRAFFTQHERNELKGRWGASSTRLTRESFLPFGSCNLCLQQARDPVSCSAQGHVYCRECAITNLLAQNKEIKRIKKEAEKRKAEDDDEKLLGDAQAQMQDLQSFEQVQAGLDVGAGLKRKPVDDLQRDLKRRAVEKSDDTSFWIPSQHAGAKQDETKVLKQRPTCPIATKDLIHDFSLKSLVTVKFSEQESTDGTKSKLRSCPSCNKILSNTTKGILAKPCGHVLCKSCSDKFQQPPEQSAHDKDVDNAVRCYVCQEDITARDKDTEKAKKSDRGLTELKSDGTGFAGGGDNMVKRNGVAFQFG